MAESQTTRKPDNQKARRPEEQKGGEPKPMNGELINCGCLIAECGLILTDTAIFA